MRRLRSAVLALVLVLVVGLAIVVGQPTTGLTALTNSLKLGSTVPVVHAAGTTQTAALQQGRSTVQLASSDLQTALEQVYGQTKESVVNIHVVVNGGAATAQANPFGQGGSGVQEGLGSGFVWDTQGDIVTNNHVAGDASSMDVTFSDGRTVPATLVAADPDSDLAVIKVDPTGLNLKPITVGDSTQVQVGQFTEAIGNPFGLEGTMTFGIVSALGRSQPAQEQSVLGSNQPSYTIPDMIQTDAPINPGNSGGVLLDLSGSLIGVTNSIESQSGSSAGIGFAIPSAIVKQVVPALITTGKYEHPYLGISGMTLTPDLAKAMGLDASQRGALVGDVTSGGPAAKGGLLGSTQSTTINGQSVNVGGDVVTGIDGQTVNSFDDLVTYLARNGKINQTVKLTVLRNGKDMTVNVTLAARPTTSTQAAPSVRNGGNNNGTPRGNNNGNNNGSQSQPQQPGNQNGNGNGSNGSNGNNGSNGSQSQPQQPGNQTAGAWLGISGVTIDSEIAGAMNLPANSQGVLVENVAANSPASNAGLQAGQDSFTLSDSSSINIGGDVITAVNGKAVSSIQQLAQTISQSTPGTRVTLSVLNNGQQQDLRVTLGTRPTTGQ